MRDDSISWSGFLPDENVIHRGRHAKVTVVLPEFVPNGYVPVRYNEAPFPYTVVSSNELARIH
jgi:hypothetical protein